MGIHPSQHPYYSTVSCECQEVWEKICNFFPTFAIGLLALAGDVRPTHLSPRRPTDNCGWVSYPLLTIIIILNFHEKSMP